MDIFDNENEIIEHFQHVDCSDVLIVPEDDTNCERVFEILTQDEQWEFWQNSSGKGDLPPDFFSDAHKMMMEVMRIDDHGHIGKNGKSIVNPTLERESDIMCELSEKGVLAAFPNAKIHLCVDTNLPSKEDHNYCFYRDNFIRTVEKHKAKIDAYRKNHPEYKMIFFVFDESSPYVETKTQTQERVVGETVLCRPHWWFFDEAFVSVILNSDIDYLVWYTPYKHCNLYDNEGKRLELPKATVIRAKKNDLFTLKYNEKLMESAEI